MSGSATVQGWADSVRSFADGWPSRGAAVAASRIERQLFADTGGDGRLSNYKGGAAAVAIETGTREASVVGAGSRGLWSMLEHGTTAHTVLPRKRFLITPQGPRRMVQVSGTNARRTWTRGVANAMPDVERDAVAAFHEVVG